MNEERKMNPWKRAIRMALIPGLAIVVMALAVMAAIISNACRRNASWIVLASTGDELRVSARFGRCAFSHTARDVL
jgi:hypothetical protein